MPAAWPVVFFLVFAISFYTVAKWKNGRKRSKLRLPPSLPSLPVVGSLPFLRNFCNISEFFQEKSKQLGAIFTFRAGNKLVLTLNNLEVLEEALVKNSSSFSSRPDVFVNTIGNPRNKGIIFMDTTSEWRRFQRTVLAVIKDFGFGNKTIMEDRILSEVESMTDFVRNKKGVAFQPRELTIHVSSNIMLNIFFGWRQDYDLGLPELAVQLHRYMESFCLVLDFVPLLRFISPFKNIVSTMQDCAKKIVALTDQEIDRCLKNNEDCFVRRLIEKEGPHYDREQLIFLLRDMINGGTDTISLTFQWSLVALANHPHIQRRLQDDIDSVIARESFPTLKCESRLPYVEATILEIFRWRTMAPLSIPRATSSDSVLGGYYIPEGALVLPNLYAAHNDPNLWTNPSAFQPERFLDKDNNVINKDRMVSFSLGRRSCPGETLARAEIFLILTSLLQRFSILPPEDLERICDKPSVSAGGVTIPTTFSIRLVERY